MIIRRRERGGATRSPLRATGLLRSARDDGKTRYGASAVRKAPMLLRIIST